MTFKQLEQFLRTEKWRAGTERDTDMCGKYARCSYCDRLSDYPCARAYDTFMKRKREGKAAASSWQFPEPDVKEKFGTTFACEDSVGGVARVSVNPEDLFFFNMGGRGSEMYAQRDYVKDADGTEVNFYPQDALSLPAGTQERKRKAEGKRWRVGYLVPLNSRVNNDNNGNNDNHDNNGTRVLVIRKRVKNKEL